LPIKMENAEAYHLTADVMMGNEQHF
jgi:hypothetical protein